MEDAPVVKMISRSRVKSIAEKARKRAEDIRKAAEYPKQLADIKAREDALRIEVAQLQDQSDSGLPTGMLLGVLEQLVDKATELSTILLEAKKLKQKMDGKKK